MTPISRPKLIALQVLVAVTVFLAWHVVTTWSIVADVKTMRFFFSTPVSYTYLTLPTSDLV